MIATTRLPLYIFRGRYLLPTKLERFNINASAGTDPSPQNWIALS
jgi:hypothetical protein